MRRDEKEPSQEIPEKVKVLLIDDNQDYTDSVVLLFNLQGFESLIARTYQEALSYLDKIDLLNISIIVLDQNLDIRDAGTKILKAIREKGIPVPVIGAATVQIPGIENVTKSEGAVALIDKIQELTSFTE